MLEKLFKLIEQGQEFIDKQIANRYGHKWENTDQEGYSLKCTVCSTYWGPDTNVDLGFSWHCFKLQLAEQFSGSKTKNNY